MGMAASQARYLGLTARKINVEYEGQQVNQQRTALANQSADLFRQYLSLQAPVPPSQSEYYSDIYTYNDPASVDGKTKLTSIEENADTDPQTYTVILSSIAKVAQYGGVSGQDVYVTGNSPDYSITLPNGTSYSLSGRIEGLGQTYVDEFNKTGKSSIQNETTDSYYSFKNSVTGTTYYINATKTGFSPTSASTQTVDIFSVMSVDEEQTKTIKNAQMSKTSSGLYSKIYWTDEKTGEAYSYKVTKDSEYDEQGYDNAMQDYNVKNELYQKELADINAKTERLKDTDRTLELRLKQLDTEQEALQTELESVKKVIDKNVDNVFKTFQ